MSTLTSERQLPTGLNLILIALFLFGGAYTVWWLPHLIAENAWWALLLFVFALASPTLWALIHESIHGALHPNRRLNDALGRALGVIYATPWSLLRFGHLTHHRVYAKPAEPTARTKRPWIIGIPVYYARILGGVYLLELIAVPFAFLPRRELLGIARRSTGIHHALDETTLERIDRGLLAPDNLSRIRTDALAILAFYGTGLWAYGAAAWMLLLALAMRGALVSFMDNVYHHRPPETPLRTQNLALPRWASAAILYGNLHAVHHRKPGVPWWGLPREFESSGDRCERTFVVASLDQLTGPFRLFERA